MSKRIPFVGESLLFKPDETDLIAKLDGSVEPIPGVCTNIQENGTINMTIFPDQRPVQFRKGLSPSELELEGGGFDFLFEEPETESE